MGFKICPLSESQKGIYLECVINPESVKYNITFSYKLPQKVDAERFIKAVKTVVSMHEIFSVVIKTPNGVPSMEYKPFDFNVIEKSAGNIEEEYSRFIKPFDLGNGPLIRAELLKTDDGIYFVFDVHHVIFDGTSNAVFIKQVIKVYNGEELCEEEMTIFDVALSESNVNRSEEYKKACEYFSKYDGVDFDINPVSDVLSEVENSDTLSVDTVLSDKIKSREIEEYAKKNKITENSVLTGAFSYTLAKYSGQSQSFFCSAHHGRNDVKLSNTIGMFVKTLPIYCEFKNDDLTVDFLRRVCDEYYYAKKNDAMPFSELANKYGINNSVTFIFQSDLLNDVKIEGEVCECKLLVQKDNAVDFDIMIYKKDGSYQLSAHFRPTVYSAEFVESFVRTYIKVLCDMIKCEKLSDISLIDEREREILDRINDTEFNYNSATTVVDLFRERAKENPESICVVYNGKKFTYGEVDKITDNVAKYLVSIGIKKEKVVGILIPRCEHMVICSLAVLKAGGAYLPLDPTYPKERLNLMVKDSGASVLIYSPEFSSVIDDEFTGERISTDNVYSLSNIDEELPRLNQNDLFVLLYTSGSTGVPKGVMFEHSNTLVTAEWVKKYFNIDGDSKVTSYASYGFDAHAFDIYPALISGAEIHVIGDDIRLDFIALQKYYNDNKITHTVMTTQVGRQFALFGGLTTLKHISVAGEKLTPLKVPEGFNMYNLYGPTEGSVVTSAFKIDKLYKDVPIGKPVDNLKIYVVDKNGKRLPTGAIGELWISGPHVTRGYLNRPEKTAESYGINPFSEEQPLYDRVYRTGDVVRLNGDGNIQFIGRKDAQVKVRGYRIELTEIEEVIRRFNGIKDATVTAFDEVNGGKFVCAYVVSDEKINVEELNEFIKSEKPPYMVPAVTMQIDKIPLNQNQKVNKKALPRPERKVENIVLPETELQTEIFNVIAEVIGHKDFGIDNDIYECGLTSIGAVKLNVVISETFNVPIKISDIKSNETVRKLEKFILNAKPQESYGIYKDYPITQTQRGIFFEWSINPDSVTYNIPVLIKLGEKVNTDKLIKAIKSAINAHPYIKTTLFADENGDIRAKRRDNDEPKIERVISENLPDKSKLVVPFNLTGENLYRIKLLEVKGANYLFADFHHIISDGTSVGILFKDIDRAYFGETLKEEKFTGFEAGLDEEKIRKTEKFEQAKKYYDGIFTGVESDCLPPKSSFDTDIVSASSYKTCCNANYEKVKEFCDKNKITVNAFFNTAFGFTLSRFCQHQNVTFTTIYNGRSDSRLSNAFSMLVKTIPVYVETENGKKIVGLIKETQERLINCMANDVYSFAEISKSYGIKSDIIFVYQGDEFNFDSLCGEPIEFITLADGVAKAPITVNVNLKDGKFEFVADYKCDYFSGEFVELFISSLSKSVSEFLVKENLSEVSLISEKANEILNKMNDTHRGYDDISVNGLFERHVKNNPDRLAVTGSGRSLTYKELNALSNRIAHSLIKLGVKKDVIVGMLLDRTIDVSVVELAILKAGGAFLGLLPAYPDDRIEYCMTDSASPIIITTEKIKAEKPQFSSSGKPFKLLTVEELSDNLNEDNPNVKIPTDSLAYCIYTSGSTGKPKGVMIEHRNLVACAQPFDFTYALYSGDKSGNVALAVSSISFDMSIMDNVLMLLNGKSVCIATDEEIHNPLLLANLIIENKVDTIATTPSFLTNYITIPEFRAAVKNLYTIVVGAEAFPAVLYNELKKISPSIHVLNGYGPTECTITCCAKELISDKNVTIGSPNANTEFYVVDKFGNILPPYACGELIICGSLVGRGYVNLPEKTKASFYNLNGKPAYHSGDTVRINHNGEVEFFGRIDNQVKLRGFRVELDEIEKVICSFVGVKQSKVLVRNNGSNDYLVGFFTASKEIDVKELTDYLKTKLTYYMVPDAIMQLEAMPLTPNGKIDKKALPEIRRTPVKKEKRAPKKSLEEQLCELFKDVLSLDEFYADDNFFEMGGTSLSASKVIMQLMSKGIKVEYQNIFDNPTPESLSEYVERNNKSAVTEEKSEELNDINGVNEILKYNSLEFAKDVKREPIGNVLLTGAVGFLGVHVLKELIDAKEGKIICIVRKGDASSPTVRLKNMLMYYFGSVFSDEFNGRISIIDADITDDDLAEKLKDCEFDTLINCAACVKHYAADDVIERINVHGVENLIKLATVKNARMIQISTTSVPGVHTDETYKRQVTMHENELFVIDDMDNKYCISKYHAELKMLEAVKNGLRGKIIRVGNLMGRHSDGEFQINFNTNAFLHALRGFATIGKSPISHSTDPMSFSPIDLTAKAVVLLAGTNDKFTAFHADNRFGFDEMQLIESCNRCGVKITPVADDEYYSDYYKMLGDEKINSRLSGLVTNDRPDLHVVNTDNVFTANVLYRLGFSWPLIDGAYLDRTIESLLSLDYFEYDDTENY